MNTKPIDTSISIETSHGRKETRIIQTYDNLRNIDPCWIGIQTLIKVYRKSIWNGKVSIETSFFISSLKSQTSANTIADGIRSHWSIESFHWIKDVTFKEDYSKVKVGYAPENYSLIRNYVINIFRNNNLHKIQETIEKAANNLAFMISLI